MSKQSASSYEDINDCIGLETALRRREVMLLRRHCQLRLAAAHALGQQVAEQLATRRRRLESELGRVQQDLAVARLVEGDRDASWERRLLLGTISVLEGSAISLALGIAGATHGQQVAGVLLAVALPWGLDATRALLVRDTAGTQGAGGAIAALWASATLATMLLAGGVAFAADQAKQSPLTVGLLALTTWLGCFAGASLVVARAALAVRDHREHAQRRQREVELRAELAATIEAQAREGEIEHPQRVELARRVGEELRADHPPAPREGAGLKVVRR